MSLQETPTSRSPLHGKSSCVPPRGTQTEDPWLGNQPASHQKSMLKTPEWEIIQLFKELRCLKTNVLTKTDFLYSCQEDSDGSCPPNKTKPFVNHMEIYRTSSGCHKMWSAAMSYQIEPLARHSPGGQENRPQHLPWRCHENTGTEKHVKADFPLQVLLITCFTDFSDINLYCESHCLTLAQLIRFSSKMVTNIEG